MKQKTQIAKLEKSVAKIQGFIGIVAIALGNCAAIITHVDEIRQYVSKVLGSELLYTFHSYILNGACTLLLVGYGSLTYWLYKNFVFDRSWRIKGAFYVAVVVTFGSTVLGSYAFLFRPSDLVPSVKLQLSSYVEMLLSQQVVGGSDDGGFRWSQAGTSNDVQVWTTAQCLMALLQQEPAVLRKSAPTLRRGFDYIERSRLKSLERGWGYMQNINWGVTEVDAWVALAYLYSLRVNDGALIWGSDDLPDVIARTRIALDLLLERQFNDGGWSVIEKTSNPKHIRTYSTIMALWAIAEAENSGDVFKDHEKPFHSAVASAVKWVMPFYTKSASGFSGWWPNPSSKSLVGAYPGLTAQTLFVLSTAAVSNPFIGADRKYKNAIETFVTSAVEGDATFQSFGKRRIDDNDRPHDGDRYLEGRTETVEQSTFLWYPWTIAMAAALAHDRVLQDYQHERVRNLSSMLFKRMDEEIDFVRNDAAIYPTAEIALAAGYYFWREGRITERK
jgi:hypothetical protein